MMIAMNSLRHIIYNEIQGKIKTIYIWLYYNDELVECMSFWKPRYNKNYEDLSKFDWKVYEQLWFKLLKWNRPSKHWYNYSETTIRQHITDNLLRQRWYDQIFWESYGKWTDNDELMRKRGYVEIYDCGQSTFVWTKG